MFLLVISEKGRVSHISDGSRWGSKGHGEQEGAAGKARSYLGRTSVPGTTEPVARPELGDSGRSEHMKTAGGNSSEGWQQTGQKTEA